jgi:Fe2+ or Zn2+ uptake regulation protein
MYITDKDVLKSLRQQGYKITPQRRSVLDILQASKGHLTPADIYQQARIVNPEISLVTVYRTLEILYRTGHICQLNLPEGHTGYFLRRPREHHHHLVCSSCGLVVDFDKCNLGSFADNLAGETGFIIKSHGFDLHGVCPACQLKNRTSNGEQ